MATGTGIYTPTSMLGDGTADATTVLYGDSTYKTPTVYAPTTVDYLVGTATGSLSAEIVVGTSPGGELGGTWASPTVDATHSGSSHAATQAAAEATAASALATHVAAADPHTGYRLESVTVAVDQGGTGQTTATAAFDALAPTTTQGDVLYHNGSDNVRLAKGAALTVLGMNNGATAPEWQTYGVLFKGSRAANAQTFSGNVTMTFDTEDHDIENGTGKSNFVHTTGIFTAPRAGLYFFAATGTTTNLADANRCWLVLQKNGADFIAGGTFASSVNTTYSCHVSGLMLLAASDTVNVNFNSSESNTQGLGVTVNWFMGCSIR